MSHEQRNSKRRKEKNEEIQLTLATNENGFNFSKERESTYFKPGTTANENFKLIINFPFFQIIVPDNTRNRSAISTLRHKYRLGLPNLTKFDEYMELCYQVRTKEDNTRFLRKMFNDVFKFIDEKYGLGNVQRVDRVFLGEEKWRGLAKIIKNTENASTGGHLKDCEINSESLISSKKGSYIIFFRIDTLNKMSRQDMVFNYLLTVAHELLHIAGFGDEVKVYSLEFKFSEKFLGIYQDRKYKRETLGIVTRLAKDKIDKDSEQAKKRVDEKKS